MKKFSLISVLFAFLLVAVSCENIQQPVQSEIGLTSSAIAPSEESNLASEISSQTEISSIAAAEKEESSSGSLLVSSLRETAASSSSKPVETSSVPQSKPLPKPTVTLQELKQSNSKKAREIIAKVTNDDMTAVEKAKATYKWLYPNFKYRGVKVDLSEGYTEQLTHELAAYYFKYHKGSCEHYAAVQKVLFSELGLESYYVQGERYSKWTKKWGSHTWLMVNIEGNMYHVDGLYGGLFYDKIETTFCVPDHALEKTHRWNRDTYVPCTQSQLLK